MRLAGLSVNSRYYVRSYAINTEDTVYGNQKVFKTYTEDVVFDIDNSIYNTVNIGSQVWLKEDLQVSHFNNGEIIGTTEYLAIDINSEVMPKYQWEYQVYDTNVIILPKIYTWYTVADERGVCPEGWRVPNEADWNELTSFLGGDSIAGGQMKEEGTAHWEHYNPEFSNESGFTALPSAYRLYSGYFRTTTSHARFWSYEESNDESAWYRQIDSHVPNLYRSSEYKKTGFPCRCIKN